MAIGNRFIDPTFDENTPEDIEKKRNRAATHKIDSKNSNESTPNKKKCC